MPLSYLRQQYLNELDEHFQLHGEYPDALKPIVKDPEFQAALKSRDLPLPNSKTATGLDSIQRAAIRLISDYHDKRPIRQKLKDFEVTTSVYQQWLKVPAFRKALEEAVERNLKLTPLDTKLALSQLILDRDLNAIKYYNELTGIYRPQTESTFNLTLIIGRLMDVLVKHLQPEALDAVATELEMLFAVDKPIEISAAANISPPRETPGLSDLFERAAKATTGLL